MTQVFAIIQRMQAACDAVAARLAREPVDRNVMMDMATVLTLVAYVLDRAEEDVAGYALVGQSPHAGSAHHALQESAKWLRDQAAGAPEREIRERLNLAVDHAFDALIVLRRMQVT